MAEHRKRHLPDLIWLPTEQLINVGGAEGWLEVASLEWSRRLPETARSTAARRARAWSAGVPRKVQDVPVGQRRNRSLPRRRATVCERLLQECPPVLRAVKKENPKQLGPVGTSSFGVR